MVYFYFCNWKLYIFRPYSRGSKNQLYPLMFRTSDVLLITKTDTACVFDFDFEKCEERAKKLNPDIKIFRVSAKTGEGMKEWETWLKEETDKW